MNPWQNLWQTSREAEQAQRRDQESEAEAKRRLRAAVRTLAGTQEGLDFLRWLFSECHVFEQEFPSDETRTKWAAGRRAFGLQVLGLCLAEDLVSRIMTPQEMKDGQ